MQERVKDEFEQLIEEGKETLKHTNFGEPVNEAQFNRAQTRYFSLRTRALNLIGRACGNESDHYIALSRLGEGEGAGTAPKYYAAALGILEAAQHDFSAGLLFDIKSLIAAEMLGDFIEQAEALFQVGYHIPAASLAGAVLEDTLRKLCIKHKLAVPERANINGLNAGLARAGVYNPLTQKQITAHADVRNNADHGHYDEVSRNDVEDMVKWVRRFAEQHLH